MTQKIYLLVSFGGSYEDAYERVKKASFDNAKLEGEAAEKNNEFDLKRKIQKEFRRFREDWEKKNPAPNVPEVVYDHQEVPKLPNREKDITPEMRAQKRWITSENERKRHEAIEIAYRPYTRWVKEEREPAIAKWFDDRGLDQKDFGDYVGDERGYRVDEVPFE